MNKSDSIKELAKALCQVQKVLKGAHADSTNPFYESKYADLQAIWDAIREPLTANQLAITQTTGYADNGGPVVVTTLMHSSGEWINGEFPIIAKEQSAQAIGSGVSYARRYALAAIVGVYQTDDDAEKSQGRGSPASSSLPPLHYQSPFPSQATGPASITDQELQNYRLPFGKTHKGKPLMEIPIPALQSALKWLKEGADKPLSSNFKVAQDAIERFIEQNFKKQHGEIIQ